MKINYTENQTKELKEFFKEVSKNSSGLNNVYIKYRTFKNQNTEIEFSVSNYNSNETRIKYITIINQTYTSVNLDFSVAIDDEILNFIINNHYIEHYKDNLKNVTINNNPIHFDTIIIRKILKNGNFGTKIKLDDIGNDYHRMIIDIE